MRKFYCYALPALFTAGNLFCGFMAVLAIVSSAFERAAWLILFAMIFDIMDGRVARLTKGVSAFGAEFDSLADAVSFGLAPAALAYCKFFRFSQTEMSGPGLFSEMSEIGVFASFVYLACGAIRLARFNVAHSSAHFTGLPIPGGAALLATLVLFDSVDPTGGFAGNQLFLLLFVTAVGVMMVSTVPYPCVKGGGRRSPRAFLVKAVFAATLLAGNLIAPERFLFAMALAYAASGPAYALLLAVRRVEEEGEGDMPAPRADGEPLLRTAAGPDRLPDPGDADPRGRDGAC